MMIWRRAPGLATSSALLLLADALLAVGTLYLLKQLIDHIQTYGTALSTDAGLLWLLAAAASLFIFAAVTRALCTLASDHLGQVVSDDLESQLNRTLARADLERLESPAQYDLTQRALLAGASRPAQVTTNLFQVAHNLLLLVGMGALLTTIHPILVAMLVSALVPGLVIRLNMGRILHDWQVKRTRVERKAFYLRWLMTEKQGAKEVRLYRLVEHFGREFESLRDQLRAEKLSIARRRALLELSVTVSVTIVFFGIVAWLAWRAASGDPAVGDLALFMMVFLRGQIVIQSLKTSIAAVFEDNLYLSSLLEFMKQRDRVVDPPQPMPVPRHEELELRGVSFTYPGTSTEVLHDVSLRVPAGHIVALVGANGSGKSTLIKLACRFYDPDVGSVLWGGSDVRSMRRDEFRARIGALFQDYVSYDTDVVENIRYGNVTLTPDNPAIATAARASLVDEFARSLPAGYATHLGRVLEEGHELSVGQWQRLALARALVSDSDLLILDEPTSAMDPDAEARLFGNFREMLGGRSALVISHRLSIVRGADYIYVMREGRIVEEGTHDELMARRGGYHDLFMAQAQAYRVEQSA